MKKNPSKAPFREKKCGLYCVVLWKCTTEMLRG